MVEYYYVYGFGCLNLFRWRQGASAPHYPTNTMSEAMSECVTKDTTFGALDSVMARATWLCSKFSRTCIFVVPSKTIRGAIGSAPNPTVARGFELSWEVYRDHIAGASGVVERWKI